MTQRKQHVILLFGGRSAEHEISIRSAQAVFNNLDPNRYGKSCIFINRAGMWRTVADPRLSEGDLNQGDFHSFLPWRCASTGVLPRGDIYFPILHGPFGEDGTIQGLFEMAEVPFVGASVLASAAGMDKAVAKVLFQAAGLPVCPFRLIRQREWQGSSGTIRKDLVNTLDFPVFVKPANLGSSIGITRVKSEEGIPAAMDTAFRYDHKVLVESGIIGREIECSVIGNEQPRASLPGEIFPFREFYDYRDKYIDGKTGYGIPAELPKPLTREIQDMAVAAFSAVEVTGMARVDFFIQSKTGRVFINEINTIPGFTEISMYPKLWQASGLPFPRLLDELIELGLERHRLRGRPESWR